MTQKIRATIAIDVDARDRVDLEEIIAGWYHQIESTTVQHPSSEGGLKIDDILLNWDVVIEPIKDE